MDKLVQDLRFGVRLLAKHRVFSAAVVLTLALGIGVTTLVFCFADLAVIRPLPIRDMERVASLWLVHPERGDERVPVSFADYSDWRARARSFEELSARTYTSYNLTGTARPMRVNAARASASLFRVWGLRTVVGRPFQDAEDRPGAPRVVVVSHGFWQRQLGADPEVIGRTLRLDGQLHQIVGVMAPEIEIGGLSKLDVWTPLGPDADPEDRDERLLRVDGRLRPGASFEQAAAEMRTLVQQLAQQYPATNAGYAVNMMPLRESLMGPRTLLIVALLSLTVAFVLAIACGNVASLMLARGAARARETALRAALGAGRSRIVLQLLIEASVLALLGGLLGVALAWGGLRLIHATAQDAAFQFIRLNGRGVGFALAVTLLTPLLSGLVPALAATRSDLNAALREGGSRGAVGSSSGRGRRGLVVVQLALALMLLVVAGLSVRTAVELRRLELGFDPHHLVTARVDLAPASYADVGSIRSFQESLLTRLGSVPAISAVAAASQLPVLDGTAARALEVEGRPPASPEAPAWAACAAVTPGYFETLGVPIVAGRAFDARDAAAAPPVVIVSRALARRHFGAEDPVGQRIRLGAPDDGSAWLTVVGVAGDVSNPNLSDPPLAQAYLPFAQQPERSFVLLMRSRASAATAAAVHAEVARLDPDEVPWNVRTLEEHMGDEFNFLAVFTAMFSSFGLAALALAAIGLYGVVAFGVSQRTREFGVRIALGAQRRDVLRLVLGQGVSLIGLGLAVGLAGGLGLARAMRAILIGVAPGDPPTFASVGLGLALVALVATLVPALRASRTDPVVTLRAE